MKPRDQELAKKLEKRLISYNRSVKTLPGIDSSARRKAFIEQLLESIHRIEYISAIQKRSISEVRANPLHESFDPLKAAILHKQRGDFDEAFWLVFLSVHFGKHGTDGWRLARDVYGTLGGSTIWNWGSISSDVKGFKEWLDSNQSTLKDGDIKRRFGNHRKYESLDAWSNTGTGAIIESYVDWISPPTTHQDKFQEVVKSSNNNAYNAFEHLYHSMSDVIRFGRTAKFDYLTMIGKLGLAKIEPGHPYLQGATGPLRGARLLFGGKIKSDLRSHELDKNLVELGSSLKVGMQVLEDALCNWQKSPDIFRQFRG